MHRLIFLAIFISYCGVISSRKSLLQADVSCGSDSSCLLLSSKPASPPNIHENIPVREINTWYPIPKWKVFFDTRKNSEEPFVSYFNKLDPRRADGNAHANHFLLMEERTQKRKLPRKVRIQYLPSNKWNNANITKMLNGKESSAGQTDNKNNKTFYVPLRTRVILLGLTQDSPAAKKINLLSYYFINKTIGVNSITTHSLNNSENDIELLGIEMPMIADNYRNVNSNSTNFNLEGRFPEEPRFQSWKRNSTFSDLNSDLRSSADHTEVNTDNDFQRGYFKNNYTRVERLPYQVIMVNESLPILIAAIHIQLPKKHLGNLLFRNSRKSDLERLTALQNGSEHSPDSTKPMHSVPISETINNLRKRIKRSSERMTSIDKIPKNDTKLQRKSIVNIYNKTTASDEMLHNRQDIYNVSDLRNLLNDTNYNLWIKLKEENTNPLINSVLEYRYPYAMNSRRLLHKEKNSLRNRRFMWHAKSDNTLFPNIPWVSNQAETPARNKSEVTLPPLNSNEESGENYSVFEDVAEHTKKSELQIDRVDLLDEDTWGYEMRTGTGDPLKTGIKDAPIPALRNTYNVSGALKNNSESAVGEEKRLPSIYFEPVINEYSRIEDDLKNESVTHQNTINHNFSVTNYHKIVHRIHTPSESILNTIHTLHPNLSKTNFQQILNFGNTTKHQKFLNYISNNRNQNLKEKTTSLFIQSVPHTSNNKILLRNEREIEGKQDFNIHDAIKFFFSRLNVSSIAPQTLLTPVLTSTAVSDPEVKDQNASEAVQGFKPGLNHTNYNYSLPKPITLFSGIISVLDPINIPEINNTFKHTSSKHIRSLETFKREGDNMFDNKENGQLSNYEQHENIQRKSFGSLPFFPFLRPTNRLKSWLQPNSEISGLPVKSRLQITANSPFFPNNEQSDIRWYIALPNEPSVSIADPFRNIFNPFSMNQREIETFTPPSKSWKFNHKKCKSSKPNPFKPFNPKWKQTTTESPEKLFGVDYDSSFPFNTGWQDDTSIKPSKMKTSQVEDMGWKNTQWTFIEPNKMQENKKPVSTTETPNNKRPWEIINVSPATPQNQIQKGIWQATQPWIFNQWIFPSGALEPEVTTPMMMMGMNGGD